MFGTSKLKDYFSVLTRGQGGYASSDTARTRAARILSQQVETAFTSVTMTVGSNLVILAVLVGTLASTAPTSHLILWATLTIGVLGYLLVTKLHYAAETKRETARVRYWARRLLVASGLRGLVWSIGTIAFFPGANPGQQMVVGVTAAAMMCGGAFALGALPMAALIFIGLTGSASVTAMLLAGTPEAGALAILTVVFVVFLFAAVLNLARTFLARVQAEIANGEQKQTIGLLLKEFEEASSDWLWHTNSLGYFVDVSARFASAAGLTVAELEELHFEDLIAHSGGATNAEARDLFSRREAMRGVEVALTVGADKQFWTLTAGPSYDEQGEFVGFRGVAGDVTNMRAAAERLENLAHFDQLTGLYNRASFLDALNRTIDRNGPDSIGLILFDLTGFKQVNDTLGHGVGDELLARLGRRMSALGARDRLFARLGGDEFALLVDAHPLPGDLTALADEVLSLFTIPFAIGPHNVVIDASAGLALGGRDGADAAALMRAADLALYSAKSNGRGQWFEFNEDLATAYLRRQNLERGLREAIDKNELSLRFQPILSAQTGQVSAFEALVRWESAEFGHVRPDEFIPIAEECGLIIPIGNWVLNEAVTACAQCGYKAQICVNVSPAQLRNKNLVGAVRTSLKQSGLPPERLVLEITEGVFLERNAQTDKTLNDLLAFGVQIALDDFGTGYSSLSYLRSFPFSKIKIDKSFIDDIGAGGPNAHIVGAIIELADALGFEVVAEGVESHVQLAEIVRLGCGFVQGYLFSEPLRQKEIYAFIDRLTGENYDGAGTQAVCNTDAMKA